MLKLLNDIIIFNFQFSIILSTFAADFKKIDWRDGRVVDYSSLENYRTERYRGFESLSLRWDNVTILIFR